MPTQPYFKKNGERVPGTTTVISRFKESGGLVHWSWRIPHDGLMTARALLAQLMNDELDTADVASFLETPIEQWDYRHVRDKAADAGTAAHAMVEAHIRGRKFDRSPYPDDVIAKADNAFWAFLEWAGTSKLEVVEPEVALVSEEYGYGGTIDAIMVGGRRAIGDWKTGNAIYQDALVQLAAYRNLWDENYPDRKINGGFHLLRFDKETADFRHLFFQELDDAWEQFKLFRRAFDIDKRLKKRVK